MSILYFFVLQQQQRITVQYCYPMTNTREIAIFLVHQTKLCGMEYYSEICFFHLHSDGVLRECVPSIGIAIEPATANRKTQQNKHQQC